jgi:predicted DNA-binding transcriptional regulator YafY
MAARKTTVIATKGLVDSDRLREALEQIREAGAEGISREKLRLKLGGVSLRTVDRAVGLLEDQGAMLERERRGNPAVIHFVLKKGPAWDEHISTEMRLALRLAGLSLAQSGTLMWQERLDALENLAHQRMSNGERRLFDNLKEAVKVQGGVDDPVEVPDILEPILKALDERKEIEVEYQAAAAREPGILRVVPFALTHDLFSGGTFLLVWDPGRTLPLHLRLSRIGAVKVTPRRGSFPVDLMTRTAQYQIGGWTSAEAPFRVKVRIQGAHWIQSFKEAPPALPDFEADAAEDGTTVNVTFQATHANGATRWLLQFGAAAEVLEPGFLREELRAQFRKALAHYE